MSSEKEFCRIANDFANTAQVQISRLEGEILELQKDLAKKQTQRNSATRALERAANYPVTRGVDYVCPACWVLEGATAILRNIPSDIPAEDGFQCSACGRNFSIPFRD